MTRLSGLSKAWMASGIVLLALAACTGSDHPEDTDTPSASQTPTAEQTQEPIQGETVEIENQLRMQVPDGWTALTDNIPGLDIYLLMIVPADTDLAELEPSAGRPDFAYLTVMDLGKAKNGAERFAAASMEADAENKAYSDLVQLDPVQANETTFYGYEGKVIIAGVETPFQYWHADANGVTYKIQIHADIQGNLPQDLVDAFTSIDFARKVQ